VKYNVFLKDIKIGSLEINEETGLYKYTVDKDATNELKDIISIPVEMTKNTDWIKPIPFFKNKIDNAKRFGREDNIGSFTDPFRLVKVK
jgi:hypothetical protein